IDRDEYDLFLSRLRNSEEVAWAIDGIREYRELPTEQQSELLNLVRDRIPGAKEYQNWRDMALHTFSLFSMGTSLVRVERRLFLAADVEDLPPPPGAPPMAPQPRQFLPLALPEPPATEELMDPPVGVEANSGSDGELAVGKLLSASGWRVVYYTNRRGFG